MQSVYAFLASGAAALLILLVVVVEALVLTWRWRRTGTAHPRQWWSQTAAGAALVAALALAQLGAPAPALGAALALAGIAHLLGARERWR